MPYKIITGMRVKLGGKEGTVIEMADKMKIKFDDGSIILSDNAEPVVDESSLKSVLMEPTANAQDPLSQPVRDTDRGVGEDQEVLGKEKQEEEKMSKEKPEDDDKKVLEKEEEDEDEEEKKKKAKKAAGAESPEESSASGADDNSSMSPNVSVPSQPQNVFVPQSGIDAKREQSTPIDGMGKSVEPDLMKSPLFINLSKQIDGIKEAVSHKVEALEKSVNDRLNNVLKDMDKIEKFYKQSFYKAIDENVAPEGIQAMSISKQIRDGEVRYRQK